ncbi:MAG: PIG-L family deacetylase [Bacteroidia bacterium]|nr:PIG-L family deacetylase [Bacteroidia bacterium]MBT8276584.1 PIG-L family deacetylase [Bacteroidia bacterium]NNF31340.1 PIG-L family deacetylase [Flavobacteriaceae bacterium]NNJ82551.1 PIG-L family deacetylase [Flavobacteriaceae bacterium]NNM09123.1 PIG-L family deacetylase [Flavobacteriaceae bacterium]
MRNNFITFLLLSLFTIVSLAQKPTKPTSSEIYHNLQKLNFLGSALYVAAHPDDENTRLISWLSNDVKARTAYLSMTRGDGGQNLIGPEIRELLGVIRTQELLAARRTDGGEQFFTRAIDFGYSKHSDETLAIWNKDEVLKDVVRAIRKFKPDVIINRFDHRTPGSTHGHHTSSAILSFEAFDIVGDKTSYPDLAEQYGIWQPRRLFWNNYWSFYNDPKRYENADMTNIVALNTGTFYQALGLSNGEIASLSRSMHKSQGFGSTGRRGEQMEWLEFLKGDLPKEKTNLFEGINTTWSRVEGGEAIGAILKPLESNFNFEDPSAMLPSLLHAYEMVKMLKDDHWREIKLKQLKKLILDCGGIFLEVVANTNTVNPNGSYEVTIEAINRSDYPVSLRSIVLPSGKILMNEITNLKPNDGFNFKATVVTEKSSTSAPYWLKEKGTLGMYEAASDMIGVPETPVPEQFVFNLTMGRSQLSVVRDAVYKYNDPVKGEVYQPMEILPEVTTSIPEKVLIFPDNKPKEVPVRIVAGRDSINGMVQLNHPQGWTVSPGQHTFELPKKGEATTVLFSVTPPRNQSEGYLRPLASFGSRFFDKELVTIDYEHIPYQRVLMPSEAKAVRIDIEKRGQRIGYIDGAGDAIPESLEYIGYEVITLDPADITSEKIQNLDAIVVGIRAYNTIPQLGFKQDILMEYVKNGGVMLVQYNTNRRLVTDKLAPYPLELSRDRVTDENSTVSILAPNHPVLSKPNKITQADFQGWVQERGLYFPNNWDKAFTPILGMNDENYPETRGSLLVAEYGDGYYVYTGLSFFRELPAGVSGAYRLFANLLSLGN